MLLKTAAVLAAIVLAGVAYFLFLARPGNELRQEREETTLIQESSGVEVIAQNLEIPWALDFLPDGGVIFTERPGRVRIIDKDGKLLPEPILTVEEVKHIGEGGLLGIAVHPDFADNKYVFLYYTYSGQGSNTLNKVVRYKLENGKLVDEETIVDAIPGASNHNGGRIKFGSDGFLYITTGDAQNPSQAQDKNSLAGKILQVSDDGKAEVYSYGHRNPQGLAWDSEGRLWETEHGSLATDELNLIKPGANYGWPVIRGDESREGMESPVLHSGSQTWAPAGVVFFNGKVYFGGLRGETLFAYDIAGRSLKEHFKGEFGRIRDVVLGPDNFLYITTSNRDGRGSEKGDDDKIIKVDPQNIQ